VLEVKAASELRLFRLLLALTAAGLLAACAGRKIEHPTPTSGMIAPEFARFGLSSTQSQCLLPRLQSILSERQLRRLAYAAGKVRQASTSSAQLNPRELLGSARLVRDPRVSRGLVLAAEACGLADPARAAARGGAAPPMPSDLSSREAGSSSAAARLPGPSAPAVWLNLGAAQTGQAIAVDAYSIMTAAAYRQAWFRVNNPAQPGPSSTNYLLRIDCDARTINPMALRRTGQAGSPTEQRYYGPGGEGPLPVERGTVMEIAYLALCTEV